MFLTTIWKGLLGPNRTKPRRTVYLFGYKRHGIHKVWATAKSLVILWSPVNDWKTKEVLELLGDLRMLLVRKLWEVLFLGGGKLWGDFQMSHRISFHFDHSIYCSNVVQSLFSSASLRFSSDCEGTSEIQEHRRCPKPPSLSPLFPLSISDSSRILLGFFDY